MITCAQWDIESLKLDGRPLYIPLNTCDHSLSLTKSKFYSIVADEASDYSNKEQMSLVLHFVDEELNAREEFLRFIHCKENTLLELFK